MLRQILKDMYIDAELLSELSEEQKQVLFIKMREEQVRRWREREAELAKTEDAILLTKKKSRNKKGTNVSYLMGRDGNPWTWVLGESDEDASEDEKEKSLQALEDKEAERKAKEIAEKEADELRLKELAAIEQRAKQLKAEQEKIEKDHAEKERLLREKKRFVHDTGKQERNNFVIKLNEDEQNELKNRQKCRREKELADKKKLEELRERKRKEEEEREKKEAEKRETERKKKEEAERKRLEELRRKKEQEENERMRQELAQKAEEERIKELEKQKIEEEKRLLELQKLKEKEEEEKMAKERELKEKQEQRTKEIYERIKKQNLEKRRREEELRKKENEAWIEREKKAREAEFQRRSSVSMARKEVKRREEEVKELQKQGFIEVASGLYRRLSQSKSRVHRVDLKTSESMKKQRPVISSPELISATGGSIPLRSIKPPKPERSPPSIPRRGTRLGPAPPPPVSNGNAAVQKRTGRPNSRQQIIEWWQEVELAKGSGFENDAVLPWFHGIITRQEAEGLLEEQPVGSFLVRVSERVWGYTISYRAVDRCKHFLIDTSDNTYQFFGHNQIAHASLADLVKFHQTTPVSGIGGELLLKACGQRVGAEPDYKELVSQTTVI